MSLFTIYNTQGQEVGTIEQPALFETPVDQKLIHRYFVWVRTMLRHTLAHTKTRGEVSGGGKKPWKQKGTGRARVGSSRSPIWRKGGTVFGPRKEQTWATRMPRAERRKALFSALASKAQENNIIVLDEWNVTTPQTKAALQVIGVLPTKEKGSILHIETEYIHPLFASTRNLPNVTSKTIQAVNILDILNHDNILLTKATLTQLTEHFTPSL